MAKIARVRKNKSMKKRILATCICIFLVWICIQLFMPNFSILSIYDRIPALLSGEVGFIINSEIITDKPSPIVYEDGEIALPLSVLNTYVDSTILKNDEYIIAIKGGKYVRYEIDSQKYVINDKIKKGKIMPIMKDNVCYVPMTVLEKLYNLEFEYSAETNILMMTTDRVSREICTALANTKIRETPTIKGFIVGDMPEGDEITKYDNYEEWSKIVTKTGITGYVKTNTLKVIKEIKNESNLEDLESGLTYGKTEISLTDDEDESDKDTSDNETENKEEKEDEPKGKINLLWYQISQKSSNPKTENMTLIPGMNVACFTWFEIVDEEGNIRDKVDTDIVKWAHKNGYEIWALVTNPFSDRELSHAMLESALARENAIKQLTSYCRKYNIDGINVDIESLSKETGPYYIQFIRELSNFTNLYDLTLSLDMYMPSQHTEFYGRSEVGKLVDYFCLMAYDEHWRTSPTEGSVASLPWVERGIRATLEEVDKDKVLLGMPSYTRRWAVKDGKVIEAKALGMENAMNDLKDHNVEIIYDVETGQNYGEYTEDDVTYKIWIEDETSVKARIELAKKYDLAGLATWKKGFEKDDIWSLYTDYMEEVNKE